MGFAARTTTIVAALLATTACATAQSAPVERTAPAATATASTGTVPIQPAMRRWTVSSTS